MTVETLTTLSNVVLVLAVVLAVLGVILFFLLDISRAWHLVTGKQIKEKKKKNNAAVMKENPRTYSQAIPKTSITEKIQTGKIPTDTPSSEGTTLLGRNEATTLLENNEATALLGNNVGTTLIGSEGGTSLLSDAGATTLLRNEVASNTQVESNPSDSKMQIVEDITFIHTEIRL